MIRMYSEKHRPDKYSQQSSISWPVWLMLECLLTNWKVLFLSQNAVAQSSHFACVSSKELLDIQATIQWGFTLKNLPGIIWRHSQIHCTDRYSQHSPTNWTVSLNAGVFVYELNACGFESSCSHLNVRISVCLEQILPWHVGNYRV